MREVGDDGVAADVLAQSERQGRRHIIVDARFEDFTERDELAALIWNLETNEGLAWDHLDDTHADHGQRTGKVLCQVRDLADLDTGRRIKLEARDHRSGRHGLDLDIDTEVAQLELDEARHGLERVF